MGILQKTSGRYFCAEKMETSQGREPGHEGKEIIMYLFYNIFVKGPGKTLNVHRIFQK